MVGNRLRAVGSPFIHTVTWMRVGPDATFLFGALALVAFIVRALLPTRVAAPRAEARQESTQVSARKAIPACGP